MFLQEIYIYVHRYKSGLILFALTVAAVLVHGYHPYAEDAEIYLPGVEKILNPSLFPSGQEFFSSHASLTLFPNLIAGSLRLLHLPLEFGLSFWHLLSIFLLLLACWELGGRLFPDSSRARWGGVCLVASLLTIPVAGTALYIVDQYLNPRNLAAFAGIFAVTRMVERKYLSAGMWLVLAACVHPLMWAFPFSFCALWFVMEWFGGNGIGRGVRREARSITRVDAVHNQGSALGAVSFAPLGLIRFFCNDPRLAPWAVLFRRSAAGPFALAALFVPASLLMLSNSPQYEEAVRLHSYFFIQRWEWYEVLGAVAPIALFWWFGRIGRAREWPVAEKMARAFVIYDVIYLVLSLVVDLPAQFESLARLQFMRSLHLLYIVMFVFIGGLLAEFVLRGRVWRWVVLFVPIAAGMFWAQRSLFPASAHVEWPGVAPRNPWAQAFVWIRGNTPVDAVFALDPEFLRVPGEDGIGFRCLAQRSRLADDVKDNGVVSMFPPLAEKWWGQVQRLRGWKSFGLEDFARLKREDGVGWVVVQADVAGLECAYKNEAVRVCRVP